jgi:hypothetical protein
MMQSSPPSANEADFEQLGVRVCAELPQGMPNEWYSLPIRVGVSLILTEGNSLYPSFFDEFAATSVSDAINLLAKNKGIYLCFNFFVAGVIPAFAFDADWPLLRRGNSEPVSRTMVQVDTPWSWCWERSLFEIRNEPISPWTSRPFLRVGGRTAAHAASNWTLCAKAFRSSYHLASGNTNT